MLDMLSPSDWLIFHGGSNDLSSSNMIPKSIRHNAPCLNTMHFGLTPGWSGLVYCSDDIGIMHLWGTGQNSIRINKVLKKFIGNEVQWYSIDHAHFITAKQINLFPTDVTYISCIGNQLFLNNQQSASSNATFSKKKSQSILLPSKIVTKCAIQKALPKPGSFCDTFFMICYNCGLKTIIK